MLKLQVNHTWPEIGINRTPARLEMTSPGYTLDMSVTQSQIKVTGTLPKITIDQSACFAEAGLKGLEGLRSELVAYSKSEMLASIGRIVDQGNELAGIPNAAGAISDQAYYNAFEQFDKEFNLGTVPTSRPRIEVVEGQTDVHVTPGTVENRTVPQKPTIHYQKGAVEVYMKKYGSIETRFVDVKG